MRRTDDFELAAEIVARDGIGERIARIERQVRLLRDQVEQFGTIAPEVTEPADRLLNAARALKSAVVTFSTDLDEEA